MAALRASDPGLRIGNLKQRAPWSDEVLAKLADGLRLVGLPE